MHHKRGRAKKARAGCLFCKPHKANGACARHTDMAWGDRRRAEGARDQSRCAGIPGGGGRDGQSGRAAFR